MPENSSPLITLSIVSHDQARLIHLLLTDLARLPRADFEVIITINVLEDESPYQGFQFPLKIVRNAVEKGFGANHNAAFSLSSAPWFAVVNPDIRLKTLDFPVLLSTFLDKEVAAVAPVVLSGDGKLEDSARRFPTVSTLARRLILKQRHPDYQFDISPVSVDWVAGMFVVFRSQAFQEVGGFDDRRFFMYLEDADICLRLKGNGWRVLVNPTATVVHTAQRASHRNLRHMRWHAVSAFRFLTGI